MSLPIDAGGRFVATSPKDRFDQLYMPEPNSGCWIWMGHIPVSGYGQFRMTSNPADRAEGAHRAAYRIYKGEIPTGMLVCHKCDTRACVNPNHLFLGSYADNMHDAARKGRMRWKNPIRPGLRRGSAHPAAKLAYEDIATIRSSPQTGVELAREFNVTPITISRIRRRIIWKDAA